MSKKKILMITSRGFQDDFRVLKSVYNISRFISNISVVELIKPKDVILENKTIFKSLKIFSIKPHTYTKKFFFFKRKINKFRTFIK